MRLLFKFTVPTERFNTLLRDGRPGERIQKILEQQKPECAYFTAAEGRRCAFVVVDVPNASRLPQYVEPWLLTFNGDVEMYPVMTAQDLADSGLQEIATQVFAEDRAER